MAEDKKWREKLLADGHNCDNCPSDGKCPIQTMAKKGVSMKIRFGDKDINAAGVGVTVTNHGKPVLISKIYFDKGTEYIMLSPAELRRLAEFVEATEGTRPATDMKAKAVDEWKARQRRQSEDPTHDIAEKLRQVLSGIAGREIHMERVDLGFDRAEKDGERSHYKTEFNGEMDFEGLSIIEIADKLIAEIDVPPPEIGSTTIELQVGAAMSLDKMSMLEDEMNKRLPDNSIVVIKRPIGDIGVDSEVRH